MDRRLRGEPRPAPAVRRRAWRPRRRVLLAEQLGAETATVSGPSVSEALLEFARRRNISKIVVGKPAHARWRDRLRGSLVDRIVRASGDIDVFIVSGERAERAPPARRAKGPLSANPVHYVWSAAVVVLCTLVCWAMFGRFDRSNLVMVYLLGVAFVASRYGRGPSALTAILGVAAFDFFFVPPHLTFVVSDTQYAVTFAVMLAVSLVISTLAAQVRAQADAARHREQRTQVLSRSAGTSRRPHRGRGSRSGVAHVAFVLGRPPRVFVPESRRCGLAVFARRRLPEHGRPVGVRPRAAGSAPTHCPAPRPRTCRCEARSRARGPGHEPRPRAAPAAPRTRWTCSRRWRGQAASGLERARLAEEAHASRSRGCL